MPQLAEELMQTYRFKVGDRVWVRDKGARSLSGRGGFRIVGPVTIQDVHVHQGRHPFYPSGEGYAFNYRGVGENDWPPLWWDCYPGCRVWATREEALAARMNEAWIQAAIRDGRLP